MRLLVISHKPCWTSPTASRGYSTDGGFPRQMDALASLFDEVVLCVPVIEATASRRASEAAFEATNLSVSPLRPLAGDGLARKLRVPWWLLRALPRLTRALRATDAVHAPIPGDVGTIGILAAHLMRRPLLVRHCGDWNRSRTTAERLWRWYMERIAGGRNVMLATGGGPEGPSDRNPHVHWIFSTSLSERDIEELGSTDRTRHLAPRLITVGRQEAYKGTDTTIAALPAILRSHPHATLDVVGAGSALPALERQAGELGVAARVHFHGAVPRTRVLELLSEADVFVFPTLAEGFPKAVGEALASGLPVVATPTSVLPWLITPDVGRIIEPGDAAAVAAAVVEIVTDHDSYKAFSAAARAVGARFTLEAWAAEIGDILTRAWGPLTKEA